MSSLLEQAQFEYKKQGVVREFISANGKLLADAAARDFTAIPGFVLSNTTELELELKLKLSGLNFEILKEAVDRDIRQAGLDYDNEYKNAVLVWELDKQQLISDFDGEMALIKQGWALSDSELAQLEVEVSSREIYLINAKAAIELQTETLKKQLVEVGDSSVDYEVQLAQQKLLTATKKLEVIPILQQIILVEQDIVRAQQNIATKEAKIVSKESDKVTALSSLLSAEGSIAFKKTSVLIPANLNLISKEEKLNAAIKTSTDFETEIAGVKVSISELQKEKAGKQVEIEETSIAAEEEKISIGITEVEKGKIKLGLSGIENSQAAVKTAIGFVKDQEQEKSIELSEKESELSLRKIDLMNSTLDKDAETILLEKKAITTESNKLLISKEEILKASKRVTLEGIESDIEVERLAQAVNKLEIKKLQESFDVTSTTLKETQVGELNTAQSSSHETTMDAEREAIELWKDGKVDVVKTKGQFEVDMTKLKVDNSSSTTKYIADVNYDGEIRTAEINAVRELTSKLQHLIG